jgi:hypothetical protein
MDNLKTNIKKVLKLNAKAMKGSLNAFNVQLEIGRLCAEGYQIWKDMPKDKRMKRDELVEAYGYKKTFFGYLRQSAEVKPEDVQRYIESLDTPTYSIKGLLAFMKPDTKDKPKVLFQFQSFKDKARLTIDENYNLEAKGMTEAELLGVLDFVQSQLAESIGFEVTSKATIELTEVEEVTA